MKNFSFLMTTKAHLLIIIFLTTLAYINIFPNQFLINDKAFITEWRGGQGVGIIGLLKGDLPPAHQGVYRPFRSLIYLFFYQMWGNNPLGYHINSIVVNLLSVVLIYFIVQKLCSKKVISLITALLFGLLPVHVEMITEMVSGVDGWGVVFFLGSFYLFLLSCRMKSVYKSWTYRISILLAGLAFFTNEITLTLPLVILLFDLTLGKIEWKKLVPRFQLYAPYWVGLAIYIVARILMIHGASRGPYLANSIYLTALTMPKVFVKYLELLIWPLNLANNHTISQGLEAFVYRGYRTEAIQAQSLLQPQIALSLLVLLALVVVAVRFYKRLPLLSFGIGWFFITLLPVSEIVPQGSILGERFLYLPSFGFLIILSYFLSKLASKKLYLFLIVLLTLIAFFGARTYLRNFDWHDEITFWSRDVAAYPQDNAYAYYQLGNAYLDRKDYDKALLNFQKAAEINPYMAVATGSVAKVYEKLGQKDLAINNYEKAINADPGFWEARVSLGDIFLDQGRKDRAAWEYWRALQINPTLTHASNNLNALVGEDFGIKKWNGYQISNLSFSYPAEWQVTEEKGIAVLDDGQGFTVYLKAEDFSGDQEGYFNSQKELYGTLVNQGLANIPNFDKAFVRIFSDRGVQKNLFYLFKSGQVIKLLVYPADSPLMGEFDKIVESLKVGG